MVEIRMLFWEDRVYKFGQKIFLYKGVGGESIRNIGLYGDSFERQIWNIGFNL